MPTVVLKLFVGQATGRTERWTDGQSGDYNMLPPLESIILLHNMIWLYRGSLTALVDLRKAKLDPNLVFGVSSFQVRV